MDNTERWEKIKGFQDYEISSNGRVRSKKNGDVRDLKINHDKDGYSVICLCENGKRSTKRIQRLVAEAFIPNPSGHHVTDHINTERSDNRAENLRWCSTRSNMNNTLTKIHISEKQLGDKNHMKGKTGKLHIRSKGVIRIEDNALFGSIHEASRMTETHAISICRCCKKKQQTAGGYHWKYEAKGE